MTNERAVEILNLDLDILGQYGGETAEAYKMAIKALEAQPNSNEFFNFDAPMVKNSEAVSRGVLTEYINTMLTSNEEWASNATNEGRWVEEKTYLYGVEILEGLSEYVNDLPSVTPERPKGKWIEIEIDAGEFIYKCTKCGMRVINPYKYCPICGSYNGGGEDEVSD